MKLRELRMKNNYSQEEIAKQIKINQKTYSNYENSKTEPSINTLIKLADLFHVTLDELVGREHSNIIDKGLLSNTELSIFNIMKDLNNKNIEKLEAYAQALIQTQLDEEQIIKNLKGKKYDR